MKLRNLLLILISSVAILKSDIQIINSFQQALSELKQVDEKTLVIFDVDDTLIMCVDKVFSKTAALSDVVKEIKKNSFQKINEKEKSYLNAITWVTAERRLVEPNVVDIIKDLQSKKIKVIGLTWLKVGPNGVVPSLQDWRFEQLLNFGIDFRINNSCCEIVFDKLPKNYGQHPMMRKGIISTNHREKGELLVEYLNLLDFTPSKIIFFDDYDCHMQSIANEMTKLKIPFKCFKYNGAENINHDINKDIVKIQYRHLVKHKEWLSDTQAEQKLKNN